MKYTSKLKFMIALNAISIFKLNSESRNEILEDYGDFFDNKIADGISEEAVCTELGSPYKIVVEFMKNNGESKWALFSNFQIQCCLINLLIYAVNLFMLLHEPYGDEKNIFAFNIIALIATFGYMTLYKMTNKKNRVYKVDRCNHNEIYDKRIIDKYDLIYLVFIIAAIIIQNYLVSYSGGKFIGKSIFEILFFITIILIVLYELCCIYSFDSEIGYHDLLIKTIALSGVMFITMNHLHLFVNDAIQNRKFIICCIILLVIGEILSICFKTFYKRFYKWIHN